LNEPLKIRNRQITAMALMANQYDNLTSFKSILAPLSVSLALGMGGAAVEPHFEKMWGLAITIASIMTVVDTGDGFFNLLPTALKDLIRNRNTNKLKQLGTISVKSAIIGAVANFPITHWIMGHGPITMPGTESSLPVPLLVGASMVSLATSLGLAIEFFEEVNAYHAAFKNQIKEGLLPLPSELEQKLQPYHWDVLTNDSRSSKRVLFDHIKSIPKPGTPIARWRGVPKNVDKDVDKYCHNLAILEIIASRIHGINSQSLWGTLGFGAMILFSKELYTVGAAPSETLLILAGIMGAKTGKFYEKKMGAMEEQSRKSFQSGLQEALDLLEKFQGQIKFAEMTYQVGLNASRVPGIGINTYQTAKLAVQGRKEGALPVDIEAKVEQKLANLIGDEVKEADNEMAPAC